MDKRYTYDNNIHGNKPGWQAEGTGTSRTGGGPGLDQGIRPDAPGVFRPDGTVTLRPSVRLLSFLPSAAVMLLIFMMSAADADTSSAQSSYVTETVVKTVNEVTQAEWTLEQQAVYVIEWEYYVRKAAHFCEYGLLGLTLIPPLYIHKLRSFRLFIGALSICVIYAFLDELHQVFSSGRSPLLTDVLIDSLGALAGILCGLLAVHIIRLLISYRLSPNT